ncbi:MAG: hypothetical protein F6K48_20950 [Okeania sp. SIO3H1]|uniref:hypothetical protein n=1 Tax=Okeania sp. SIO1I7 TaxID=2607772 RepID=UPI0013C89D19|nr:hypothetical protein [Okeania sp. SIO1I7]NEN91238.1 hypothetical protein [Okeania sp. SIO3H1]NET27412.1 hypothetical protein [Okeania sp. SIO1I7]
MPIESTLFFAILMPTFLAVDPIITPMLVGKLIAVLAGTTAVAAIAIKIIDSVVERQWKKLSNSQRNKVKRIYAKAYKFWENHSPKIKFVVDFMSSGCTIATSWQTMSFSSAPSDMQNTLNNQGSISQDYTVS